MDSLERYVRMFIEANPEVAATWTILAIVLITMAMLG